MKKVIVYVAGIIICVFIYNLINFNKKFQLEIEYLNPVNDKIKIYYTTIPGKEIDGSNFIDYYTYGKPNYQKILIDFDGEVPNNLEDLITLPGVGRKTANVVLGHAFGIPGMTVDTHFGRLSRRFGWSKENNPVKVEFEVGELITRKEWTNLSQRLIWHGRRVCHSRKPACGACGLAKLCPSFGIGESDPIKAKRLVKVEADFR